MKYKGTTILSVRRNNMVAIGCDGQVTFGNTVFKRNSIKIRRLYNDKVIAGFAGATADAFTLFERFEIKLNEFNGNLIRSAVELAKEWRTDKILRRLEALIGVVDCKLSLIISGNGDVIEPEDGIIAIGSGGAYAKSSAIALLKNTKLNAYKIVEKSLNIASEICIYTNNYLSIEKIFFN